VFPDDENTNDFGESSHISSHDANLKTARKKSLKFYTSQIAQKANKRTGAGRDAGGDADLPYKERLRDRVARLNAEAEKRGKKLDSYGRGAELGGEGSDGEQEETAREVRDGEDDEYYDLVNKSAKAKKEQKAEMLDAVRLAKEQNAILRVEEGEIDEEGKRAIGYVIEKNKGKSSHILPKSSPGNAHTNSFIRWTGLAPKRKKDVRNPRVKKRKKFEEKKRKLGSMKAVWKGGEERGGYGGEKTGIKSGLVKSVKL
jgi:U3 small nucleolar RNA-associated protein 3